MTTIKRKANVGDRILITKEYSYAEIGDIFKVDRVLSEHLVGVERADGVRILVNNANYEVIAEEPSQVAEALMAAHDAIDELRRKAYGEGFDAGRAFEKDARRARIRDGR